MVQDLIKHVKKTHFFMKPGGSVTCLQNFTIEPFLKYHTLVSMKTTENEVGSSLFNSFNLSGNYMYHLI